MLKMNELQVLLKDRGRMRISTYSHIEGPKIFYPKLNSKLYINDYTYKLFKYLDIYYNATTDIFKIPDECNSYTDFIKFKL